MGASKASKGKFKVGDRVKCVGKYRHFYSNEHVGKIGKITGFDSPDFADVLFDDGTNQRGCYPDNIELAPKFAVGDKVRVVKRGDEKDGSHHEASIGYEAVIDDIMEFDGETEYHTAMWYFYEHEIEPVTAAATQPPLAIQDGRYYKTRDGRKVGPATGSDCGERFAYRVSNNHYRADGSHFYGDNSKDLIAEWVDEPVADAKTEPKFKVGDRVEATANNPYGKQGRVVEVRDAAPEYLVAFDNWRGGHGEDDNRWWLCAKHLRLVAPATSGKRNFRKGDRVRCLEDYPHQFTAGKIYTVSRDHEGLEYENVSVELDDNGSMSNGWNPNKFELVTSAPAIVALIENGQPKPATYPFVHPDRDSAAKEARRLAGQHKGKEFGVYELVSSEKEAKMYEHEWQRLAANKKTGDAAKEMRKLTGLSLGDSKRAVERWLGKAA